jgi:cobalt/nickel transport system ATP-binding protein
MEPSALILDEPTNALDEKHFIKLLQFLKGTDKSVLVITHDRRLIRELNWKVYELKNGKLTEKN